jgi:Leu/Phe-tRNA-protein transferase
LGIARSSKGRLITDEKTVSIKVRLDKGTAEQLRKCADELQVPMATVIRQGISKVYEELLKESK